jgi:hypothetical protein
MAASVWSDNRYRNPDGSVPAIMRAYYDRSFVVFTTPSGSGASHALDLTGIGQPPPARMCGDAATDGLLQQREAVVWALGYRVMRASVQGDVVDVEVQSTGAGFHMAEIVRPSANPWTARFLLPDGREVARWATTDRELTAR